MKPNAAIRSRTLVLSVLLSLSLSPAYAQTEIQATTETTFTYNEASGPGAANSYLTQGYRYSTGITLSGQNRTDLSEFSWRIGFKATNDRLMEKQGIALTGLEVKLADQKQTSVIGDTMSSFSDYAMSASLKGFSYRLQDNSQAPEFTAVYGVAYPRWENFWGGADYKAIKRTVSGLRYKRNAAENLSIGLSYVKTVDSGRVFNWDPLTDGNSVTLDWEYTPASDLTIKGESSYSSADTSSSNDGGLTYNNISKSGQAHKLSISRQSDGGQSSLEYERVDPDYEPLMGMATPDRERIGAKWRSKLAENLSMNVGMLWYRDYLSAQSAQSYRSTFYKPEIGFTFNRPFNRADASFDISFRQDKKNGGSNPQRDNAVSMSYRDKFGATEAEATLDYVKYDTKNYTDNHDLTGNTSLAWSIPSGECVLRPTLQYGYWRSHDYLNMAETKTYEASVGIGLTHQKSSFTSNLKFGSKQKDTATTNDDTGFANLSINYNPPFLAKYNGAINLQAFYNDYRFERANAQDYRENGATMTVSLNF